VGRAATCVWFLQDRQSVRSFALVRELARGLEPLTCCFSAAGIGGLWPSGIVWRLA
jgi:hypothetical protein